MKIIRTREKEEIEITHLELNQMLFSSHLKMRECACEILIMLKRTKHTDKEKYTLEELFPKVSVGVDLAKEGSEDKSCMVFCSTEFGPNSFHCGIEKLTSDIRKKERERIKKIIFKLKDDFLDKNRRYWNVMIGDGPDEAVESGKAVEKERKRGVLTALSDLIELIRKEK